MRLAEVNEIHYDGAHGYMGMYDPKTKNIHIRNDAAHFRKLAAGEMEARNQVYKAQQMAREMGMPEMAPDVKPFWVAYDEELVSEAAFRKKVIRHEYGHALKETIERGGAKKLGVSVEEMNRVFGTEAVGPRAIYDDQFFRDHLSTYGSQNHHEMFAEAFAKYTSPYYKAGDLPPEVEGICARLAGDLTR